LIVRFDGEAVRSAAQLARLVRETPAGRAVAIDVMRGGSTQKLEATLDSGQARGRARRFGLEDLEALELPEHPDPPEAPELPGMSRHEPRFDFRWHDDSLLPRSLFFKRGPARLGIEYQPIQGQLAKFFKLPGDEGVLVTSVDEAGPAAAAGLTAGDVVLEIDGRPIEDTRDLRRAVDKAAPSAELHVKVLREGRNLDLKVKLQEEKKASEN
jgi:S1-C subfamily serine protease